METTLLEAATSQGIWVLLFISLFLYRIKHHEKMEEKQESRRERIPESDQRPDRKVFHPLRDSGKH